MILIAKVRILEGSFQESKDVVSKAVGRPRKSLRKMELEKKGGKRTSYNFVSVDRRCHRLSIIDHRELKKSGKLT